MKNSNLSIKIALRNILVQPTRALMTVAGVMGCVALLVCAFGIGDTVEHSINNELGVQFIYDINTTYKSTNKTELYAYLDSIDANYEKYQTGIVSASGSQQSTIAVEVIQSPSNHTTIDVSKGPALSKSTADDLGVKAGNTIGVESKGVIIPVKIESIVKTSVSQGLFISTSDYQDLNFNLALFDHLWISTDKANQDTVDKINEINGTNGAWLISDKKAEINTSLTSIKTIRNTMVIFSILLSVVVLYNFAILNMIDRIRDIATLKVLGLKNSQIGRMLIYEMMFLILIGTGLGLVLGYPVLVLVMSANKVAIVAYLYLIKPFSYFLSAIISISTGMLFNTVFTLYISKVKMVESLKSIE